MCGISGVFRYASNDRGAGHGIVTAITEYLRHRGPDGSGLWSSRSGDVVLGHRRLAVIDTSVSGAQPMSDAAGRWTITFNGEIYNYKEIRAELEALGCRFLTTSDTEVLINAFAHWGQIGLRKIRGMYAFALWDNVEHTLWLVRDPHGIKPLYYAVAGGAIWFASEARALAAYAPVDTTRDPAALVGFYMWGSVPEPFTWWQGIKMLPAGHVCEIQAYHEPAAPHCFAAIEETYASEVPRSLSDGELREILLESIRYHLVADVPVGVFLSGGVDSSCIAALATEAGARLKTVTLAFEEYAGSHMDEAPQAEATARALGSSHTTVKISERDFDDYVDEFTARMDQPTIDGLNNFLVCKVASQLGLKVMLSGLGGDELVGGYPSFTQLPKLLNIHSGLGAVWGVGKAVERVIRTLPFRVHPKAGAVLSHASSLERAYLLRRSLFMEYELEWLVDADCARQGLAQLETDATLAKKIAPLRQKNASIYSQIAALETTWYMRHQLLRDADWTSMAFGLELRVPFVDYSLLRRLGPAIASAVPPRKTDLVGCSPLIDRHLLTVPKRGFTTPAARYANAQTHTKQRGLRGWAIEIHRRNRNVSRSGQLAA